MYDGWVGGRVVVYIGQARSLLLLDGEEELELWGQFLLGVQSVGKVDSSNPAIGVDGHS
jgi:hypothetical protein